MLRGGSLSPLAAAVMGICGTLLAATYTAQASHVAGQGGWPPPVDLSQSGLSDSRGPELALAENGHLHVIWTQPGQPQGVTFTVYYASSHNQGSNWSYSVPLTPAGKDREAGAMDVDEYGVHTVWIEHPGEFELWYALLSEDGWEGPTMITHSNYLTREILSPDVATTQGFVHAVWSETNRGAAGTSKLDVFYSRSVAAGLWSDATTTVETDNSSDGPRVAADQGGDLHVVWEESPNTTPHSIYYISGTVGTEETVWSIPITVSEGLAETATTPQIAVGSDDDTVHVVFAVNVIGQQYVQDIYYASFPITDAGVVSATLIPGSRVTVTGLLPGYASPALAVFGADEVHVAWNGMMGEDDSDRIYYSVSDDRGAEWSDPVPVSPGNNEPDAFPSLGADAQFVHVVWQERVPPTDQDIYYNRRFPVRLSLPLTLKAY